MCDLWQWQDTISHLGELFIIICSVTQQECIHLVVYTPAHTKAIVYSGIAYSMCAYGGCGQLCYSQGKTMLVLLKTNAHMYILLLWYLVQKQD